MPTHHETDEVRNSVRNRDLLSKSESDLTRMSSVMTSWILSDCPYLHEAQACLTAIQNQLEHIRTDRMAKQGEALAGQVEKLTSVASIQKESAQVLNGQTETLINETIALNRYAKEQLALGLKLDRLTRGIWWLTFAVVVLSAIVAFYSVKLDKDTHTAKQSEGATSQHQTNGP
jgi:hypothetical protein